MKNSRFWLFFALSAAAWLAISLVVAPSLSGEDVYIFRDAGWNLASHGSFEAAALVYMTDIKPHLYAHYTPMMPLLFAGYLSVFPRNPYSGTIFNLLLGLAAAAVALYWILKQPPGKARNWAAFAVIAFPVAFITYDRPEALAAALFALPIALAANPKPRPILTGLAIWLVFMAHPFATVATSIWVALLYLMHGWSRPDRWVFAIRNTAIAAVFAALPIVPIAWLYHSLDPDSLARFAAHCLHYVRGQHSVRSGHWLLNVRRAAFGLSALQSFLYLASIASMALILVWAIRRRKEIGAAEWLPVSAFVLSAVLAISVFSVQANYIYLLPFIGPLGLLIASRYGSRLAWPALALFVWVILIRLPIVGVDLISRVEQIPSYRDARGQADLLRAQLSQPEAVVAVEGDSYDMFKPDFSRLIRLQDVDDVDHFRAVAALANCYDTFHGADNAVRPLSPKIDPADFKMIQADPDHMWVTLFGHRMMRAQWGYGCDLYVRKDITMAGSGQP